MMIGDCGIVILATTMRADFPKDTAVFSCTRTGFITHFSKPLLSSYAAIAQDQFG